MDDASDIAYAVCRVADIPNRQARAFSLLRLGQGGAATPFHVVILRWDRKLYGYVNRCPHHGEHLDWEPRQFFDPNGTRLMCGKHGALFQVEDGLCIDGPCRGERLEQLRLTILEGDVCITGVAVATD